MYYLTEIIIPTKQKTEYHNRYFRGKEEELQNDPHHLTNSKTICDQNHKGTVLNYNEI